MKAQRKEKQLTIESFFVYGRIWANTKNNDKSNTFGFENTPYYEYITIDSYYEMHEMNPLY
jgi:hypothetical protein